MRLYVGCVHFYKTWQHCVEKTLSLLLVLYGQITNWQCERMNILFLSFSCNSDFIGVISLCTLICICDTVVYTNTYTCIVIHCCVCTCVCVCGCGGGGGCVCMIFYCSNNCLLQIVLTSNIIGTMIFIALTLIKPTLILLPYIHVLSKNLLDLVRKWSH